MRFESILGLSIAVHLVLMIVISSTMEMLDYEDVPITVSYTHLRAHETREDRVCRRGG